MITPNNQSTLSQWIDWLLHLHADEIDLGLERIRLVANQMQVTRPAPFVITVAGTNGKGSSVAMLSAILIEAGYRIGTYTSPHILAFNERIQINGKPVNDQLIIEAFDSIENQRKTTKLTYFEFSTLSALSIFKQSELDVVVLEVGLGGRLDAVNIVDADASLITAIDVDHIDWLGDDRNLIALEKAGVMRKEQISVCSDSNPPASLLDFAEHLQVDFSVLGKDFIYTSAPINNQAWLFQSLRGEPESITIAKPSLQGAFQLQNASGVVALILKIKSKLPVKVEAINQGLLKVKHPGRLERLQLNHQAWLIDVAHNPQSAEVLAEYLATQDLCSSDRVAVFSALRDKDMLPMVKVIAPWVKKWVIADLAIPRSTDVGALKQTLLNAGVDKDDVYEYESINVAVQAVKELKNKHVLVWGSFFTVAQALTSINSQ
ncbi:folylpolyglutamate synthase/dihydrofolate synthase family protein [Thiomicrorhabdus sp. Kp2]|uniref:bifunctional folylpolyglutamate synthase/dihydrofolate synthase n=1 Tax=Thiomicrorhabdus sp. Kp2 TaxID=1123518 RepID=UPI000427938D|nr:folylpolyglutamate synthase/dihydrofolate synthase family protein [Thiomicrorhabdus sp. Kp2]